MRRLNRHDEDFSSILIESSLRSVDRNQFWFVTRLVFLDNPIMDGDNLQYSKKIKDRETPELIIRRGLMIAIARQGPTSACG